jgi:hypothetical protein
MPRFLIAAVISVATVQVSLSFQSLTPGEGDVAVIRLDPTKRYQTISGWEAVSNAGQAMPTRHLFKQQLLEDAVNDLGLNRVRLEVRSGSEHQRDTTAEFDTGLLTRAEHRAIWYATVNDNKDPKVINWSGFHFTELDFKIDEVVNPLRALLRARGEELYVVVTYVAFTIQNAKGAEYIHTDPEEYAEFVLATYTHIRDKYGWEPDAWEVILEPSNGNPWNGAMIGRAIVAAAKRLSAAGFSPRFIAPSAKGMAKVVPLYEELSAVRGARALVSEISYHRYDDASETVLRAIATRAAQYRVATSMLEYIGAGYEQLHEDLKVGNVSAWQQFVLAPVGPGPRDNGAQLYWIDNSNPAAPKAVMGSRTKFLRQYFKFVRRGAVRIEAMTSNSGFDPVAFVNPDGRTVVVVKAASAGEWSIDGFQTGTYGIKYTTRTEYDVDRPDVTIAEGDNLIASIPAPGVLTVYER